MVYSKSKRVWGKKEKINPKINPFQIDDIGKWKIKGNDLKIGEWGI